MANTDQQSKTDSVLTEAMHKAHEDKVLQEKERALATAAKLKALHQQVSSSSPACARDPNGPSHASVATQSDDKRSQKQRMLAGDLYYAFDHELLQERQRAKAILAKYNSLHKVPFTAPGMFYSSSKTSVSSKHGSLHVLLMQQTKGHNSTVHSPPGDPNVLQWALTDSTICWTDSTMCCKPCPCTLQLGAV
jgi:hypothetical protein